MKSEKKKKQEIMILGYYLVLLYEILESEYMPWITGLAEQILCDDA